MARFSSSREDHSQRLHDVPRDLVLHREDVLQIAIVSLGPEMITVGHVDELGGDSQPVPGFADASLHDGRHVELLAHLADVLFFPLKANADEREATCSASIFVSALMISSAIPSQK